MLEEEIKVEKKEGTVYPPMPEDVYQVELLDIAVKESPSYDDKNILEKKFSFQFVVLDHRELRTRNLWANFIPTYLYVGKKGKNKLYQIMEALLGHEMTKEEEAVCDKKFLNSLIGKQCKVFIEIKVSGEKKFNNIIKFVPVQENLIALTSKEKEKCTVKEKDEKIKKVEEGNEEVNVDDIPF